MEVSRDFSDRIREPILLRKKSTLRCFPQGMIYIYTYPLYPFWCKVYFHCLHCVYGHSGADRKDKLFYFFAHCVYA